MFQEIIPINRIYGYHIKKCLDQNLSKDIRIYDMSPMLTKSIADFNKKINDHFGHFYKTKKTLLEGLEKVIIALQTGLIYLYVSFRYFIDKLGPRITLGEFTMYASSAITFSTRASTFFRELITINQYLTYLKPFLEFMSLPEDKYASQKLKAVCFEKLEFKNVSFQYPKGEKEVLTDISFIFERGEKVSIVGLNGAGKTTLIKLICRFYKPTKGIILYNGKDIFEYDYDSYIQKISAVFQDYRLFAFSIKENIACIKDQSQEKLTKIIDQVGLTEKIKDLPAGLETKLNKEYDPLGTELSGGQGQKIAIARALYKEADLVILDEPTSALDPLAEADIYKNFNELVISKTALYISHRMSSSVFCDKILIIDQGRISDFDTHENLMKKTDSLYFKLFTTQAKNYKVKS